MTIGSSPGQGDSCPAGEPASACPTSLRDRGHTQAQGQQQGSSLWSALTVHSNRFLQEQQKNFVPGPCGQAPLWCPSPRRQEPMQDPEGGQAVATLGTQLSWAGPR